MVTVAGIYQRCTRMVARERPIALNVVRPFEENNESAPERTHDASQKKPYLRLDPSTLESPMRAIDTYARMIPG